MENTVVIYSGGSDSFTLLNMLLAHSRAHGAKIKAVSFNYGQRHAKELEFAKAECIRNRVEHTIIEIPFLHTLSKGSALTHGTDVPEGFYADENMKKTVVPNRNMIMLAIATAYAINNDCQAVAYGAHAGDHDIYPDCRAVFVEAMSDAIRLCDWSRVKLTVPFIGDDKRGIYAWGLQHGLDYAHSWTCYNGREKACGKCGSCVERLHAFHDIGAVDPLEYEDREYFKTVI